MTPPGGGAVGAVLVQVWEFVSMSWIAVSGPGCGYRGSMSRVMT